MFQADGDQLMQISQLFAQQAAAAEEMLQTLSQKLDELESNGWSGQASRKFYDVMTGDVIPGLKKLQAYMQQSSETAQGAAQHVEAGIQSILAKVKTTA